MDEVPTEILWVRIKERTGEGDTVVGIFCRPPDQEQQVDEALNREIGAASHSQAVILMEDFNHPTIY